MSELPLPSDAPWNRDWPADELERVPTCPICGGADRTVLHEHLVDSVFFASPGTWTLHGCSQCGGAYLDPRPSPASIHRAYTNYYTHQQIAGKDDYAALSPLRKLRRRLVNGYTNWRFGTRAFPSSAFGVLAAYALPSSKKVLDREYRHLPKRPLGDGYLLDVGCGNGSFLSLACTCGWTSVGLDPDPMAVANAAEQGLTVYQGGIEYFDGQTELFDVITLSHVIEHVYDPRELLKRCYDLLKPGGQLWIETPNIDSFGYARFQANWRGLETPRHLVLFNRKSLSEVLGACGFAVSRDCESPSHCAGMFQASAALERGQSPYLKLATSRALKFRAAITAILEQFFPSRREFLTVVAPKIID